MQVLLCSQYGNLELTWIVPEKRSQIENEADVDCFYSCIVAGIG